MSDSTNSFGGRNMVDLLESDGFFTILVLGFKVENGVLVPRVVAPLGVAQVLAEYPAVANLLREALDDLVEVGKPPDDRHLPPDITFQIYDLSPEPPEPEEPKT